MIIKRTHNLCKQKCSRVDDAIADFLTSQRSFKYPLFPSFSRGSRVAQWKRAGPITQRSEDQNLALLGFFFFFVCFFGQDYVE